MASTALPRVCAIAVWLLLVPIVAAAGQPVTLPAADGQTVYATRTGAGQSGAIALLFHQAGANRHEYDTIVPRIAALGFDTLAVDARSGGQMFGHGNQTVQHRGQSTAYLAAYPDLIGALNWARRHHYKTIVAVGSSYSASLVILLAARTGHALTAAAVFSPGEYFDDPDLIKKAVARVDIPLYITTDPSEEDHVDEVLRRADGAPATRYKPAHGVHGASTLIATRDPDGYRANWRDFKAFLERFAPAGSRQQEEIDHAKPTDQ